MQGPAVTSDAAAQQLNAVSVEHMSCIKHGHRFNVTLSTPLVSSRRSPTPPEVRMQRERERELAELERATRTVFAFNISIKADERDIFGFFSKAGQVGAG
jgi:hypothetical protein